MGKIPTLKHIDFDKGYFDAGGHRYYIQNSLSFNRYKEYVKMQSELAFGTTPEDIINFIDWGISNFSKPMTYSINHAIVQRFINMKEAYKSVKVGEDKRLIFCTLFVNREDEDITVWDEKISKAKISDWSQEGYDVGDFFLLSAKLSPSSRAKYLRSQGLTEKDVENAAEKLNQSKETDGTESM